MPRSSRPKPFAVGSIRVRVHSGPREDGAWRWRADKPNGRGGRIAVWSGWADRDEAERMVIHIAAGGEPEQRDATVVSVYDLMDVWIGAQQQREDIAESTIRSRRSHATHVARSSLRDVVLDRLTRRTLERYRDVELRRGRAPSTVREDLRHLRQAWRWGREIGLVPDRELASVDIRAKRTVYSRRTPELGEVLRVLDALREGPPWAWRATYLLWSLGARKGEVAYLTWKRVQLDGSPPHVEVAGKTGSRVVPLRPEVVAELRRWPRERETVHGRAPGTVVGQLHAAIQAACDRAGVERFPPHGLRRAAVDALYRQTRPEVAAAVLGHSPTVALRHYRRVQADEMARAVAQTALGVVPGGAVLAFDRDEGGDP